MFIREQWDMFQVCFYVRRHHTNPDLNVYVRAKDSSHAVCQATDQIDQFQVAFERIDVEKALWKQEEEVCQRPAFP